MTCHDVLTHFWASLLKGPVLSALPPQSLNSTFSEIQSLISDLSKDNLLFDAIYVSKKHGYTQMMMLEYSTCQHTISYIKVTYVVVMVGLILCNNRYTHSLRSDLYKDSTIWEGLFIDIAGENIINKITLGNIYKLPKDNSNNQNISCFIDEITPSLHTLSKENSYSILVGDFNIDLLKLNERQIFSKLFDNMCSSGFFPHITVPTRFATNSCSLIDQIYI